MSATIKFIPSQKLTWIDFNERRTRWQNSVSINVFIDSVDFLDAKLLCRIYLSFSMYIFKLNEKGYILQNSKPYIVHFFLFMCYHIWSFEFVIIIQFHLIPCNFVFKFKEISTRSNVCFMAFRKQLHSINHFSNAPFRVKIFFATVHFLYKYQNILKHRCFKLLKHGHSQELFSTLTKAYVELQMMISWISFSLQ